MNSIQSQTGEGDSTAKAPADARRIEGRPVKSVMSGGSRQTSHSLWLMKKTVLLIDVDSTSRESRSKIMRGLGVTVHCAATVTGARQKLEAGSYNLVLVDLGSDVEGAKSFVAEIRAKNSRQLVAFLVGSPLFVAKSLDGKAVAGPNILPLRTEPVQKTVAPAPVGFNFGQKIKDAEAEQIA